MSKLTYGYDGKADFVTIPTTGVYDIIAYGGQGGVGAAATSFGLGVQIGGYFTLQANTVLELIVGGYGLAGGYSGGGGGGTFVIETFDGTNNVNIPLVIAGGGGGGYGNYGNGGRGLIGANGRAGYGPTGGAGGKNGSGGDASPIGYSGGGGGGLYSVGGYGPGGGGGGGAAAGGAGGIGAYGANGGFGGGGGGGRYGGGGGGGFSGGGGGGPGMSTGYGGGGGGSYLSTLAITGIALENANAGAGSVTITSVCYLRGTRILTPTGQVSIERLNIGDRVVTRFGGTRPIRWIGRQNFHARFLQHNRDQFPVQISAGALGDNTPARALYVSPGHAMLVGGQLVLARSLVNGVTITQDHCPDQLDYYQLDLDRHDCVIAEGAWSESFADAPGLRDQFHNAAAFAALYPNHPPAEELQLCAPRPEQGARLDEALRSVVARAAATVQPGPLRGNIDRIEAPWIIQGWAQDIDHPELPVLLEILLGDAVIATTLACDHRQDLLDAGIGRGRAAFCVIAPVRLRPEMLPRLRVRRVCDQAELPMAESCVAQMFSALRAA